MELRAVSPYAPVGVDSPNTASQVRDEDSETSKIVFRRSINSNPTERNSEYQLPKIGKLFESRKVKAIVAAVIIAIVTISTILFFTLTNEDKKPNPPVVPATMDALCLAVEGPIGQTFTNWTSNYLNEYLIYIRDEWDVFCPNKTTTNPSVIEEFSLILPIINNVFIEDTCTSLLSNLTLSASNYNRTHAILYNLMNETLSSQNFTSVISQWAPKWLELNTLQNILTLTTVREGMFWIFTVMCQLRWKIPVPTFSITSSGCYPNSTLELAANATLKLANMPGVYPPT